MIQARHIIPNRVDVQDHPIYQVESSVRRRKYRRQPSVRYILFTIAVALLGVLGLWLALTVIRLINDTNLAWLTNDIIIFQTAQEVLNWSLFISLIVVILLDTHAITASVNSINREMVSGHWNLLQLTNLSDTEIITAKHVLAQERTWRTLLWVVSLRLAVIFLLMAQVTVVAPPYGSETQLRAFLREFNRNPLPPLIMMMIVVVICVVYLVEPFWRMRALTASGIMVSSRIRATTRAVLAGLGVIGLMWFSQVVLSLLYGWFALKLLFDWLPYTEVRSLAFALVVITIYGVCIWFFYRTMQRAFLRLARRFAFTHD